MNEILALLASLPATIAAWLSRAPAPTKPLADPAATLVAYLESQSISIGPMLRTGGVIHALTPSTATADAAAILKYAAQYALKVSLVTSYVEQESRGDVRAIDPNDQDAKPGETPAQAFAHADLGIAQLDGATLEAMPEFEGATIPAIEAKAYDSDWAINQLCRIVAANQRELIADFVADPSLVKAIPNGDVRIAYANAYNAGVRGTTLTLRSATPNLAYGQQVVARADKLAPLLDGPA